MVWKRVKLYIILVITLALVGVVISMWFCNPDFSKCANKKKKHR